MLSLRGMLLALCFAGAAMAQQGARPTAREALESARCQTELPGAIEGRGRGPAPPRKRERTRVADDDGSSVRLAGAGGELATVLLWVGVAVAVLMLVAAILRQIQGRREAFAASRVDVVRGQSVPTAAAPAVELPDYERLAAAGDFAAAVHALLAHAIGAWTRGGGSAPLHATARDVLRRVRAAGTAATAIDPFARLVGSVERVHFGGAGADRGTFESSRAHLHQWESACPPPR